MIDGGMRIQILFHGRLLDTREVFVDGTDLRDAKKRALKLAIDGGQVKISEAFGVTFQVLDEVGGPSG
jgi:hypothetical protein